MFACATIVKKNRNKTVISFVIDTTAVKFKRTSFNERLETVGSFKLFWK